MAVDATQFMSPPAPSSLGRSAAAPRPGTREFALRRLAGAIGLLAILAAGGFLAGSFVAEELLARAFFLGAFTTAITGAMVSFLVSRYRFSAATTDSTGADSFPQADVGPFPSRYRSIFDLAPLPMVEVDDTGRIVGANQQAEEWLRAVRDMRADGSD